MLHICYIYLHDWVIYVGQMLVNIPAPWSIWACEPLKKQTTICCCGRSSTEPRFGHAWPTGNTAATVKSGNSCGKAQLGTYETSKCAETRRKERRKEKQSCYWCTFYLLGGTRVGFYMFLSHSSTRLIHGEVMQFRGNGNFQQYSGKDGIRMLEYVWATKSSRNLNQKKNMSWQQQNNRNSNQFITIIIIIIHYMSSISSNLESIMIYNYIWRFPKIGGTPRHPHLDHI